MQGEVIDAGVVEEVGVPGTVRGPRIAHSEARERLIRTVAILALLYGAYWIYWRWTTTINTAPEAVVPS
ncbi:MAG TPA: hypothetical protein VFO66_07495, partial [Gemmatimonadaceae bacterium]|nr:hypothetical protein [Gemmatimonadaceae bacterium]